MSSTSFFIEEAAEKKCKKVTWEAQTISFSLVLSIAHRGKDSRSLKCDRIGETG